jgi:hypothetical protein
MDPMTPAELRTLPAAVTPAVAFRALGIGRTTGYSLMRSGQFPVPVLQLGATYRIRTADLLALLGVEESRPGAA